MTYWRIEIKLAIILLIFNIILGLTIVLMSAVHYLEIFMIPRLESFNWVCRWQYDMEMGTEFIQTVWAVHTWLRKQIKESELLWRRIKTILCFCILLRCNWMHNEDWHFLFYFLFFSLSLNKCFIGCELLRPSAVISKLSWN